MEVSEHKGSNRMVLLLIAGIPVTVILVATWLWYYVAHGDLDLVGILGTSNSGELVQPPRQLTESVFSEADGAEFHYLELDPKWTFLIPGGARCATQCENTLYTTRQIHIALGGNSNRIRRIYVGEHSSYDTVLDVVSLSDNRRAPVDFADLLVSEHAGLRPLVTDSKSFQVLFSEYLDDPATWYLMDPAGWIMMSYNAQVDYKGVIADLKFLLKNSSE